MLTNLFPAILLAGPPHCGKSVLAFLLTYRLRELGISHYLLRAVPDGEGDWFLAGQPEVVQTLRSIHKTSYSSSFVEHMLHAIQVRLLPLLVDIGGRPQGDQFGIIRACTHSILLYRTEEERNTWRGILTNAKLLPIAELRSTVSADESVEQLQPYLSGMINGLERDATKRKTGESFGALLERVSGICSYDDDVLEKEHERHAPFPVQNERGLARSFSIPVEGKRVVWSPGHLARLPERVPNSSPLAIYGRGPVWLAAALAARALPADFAIFDARYGWMLPVPVGFSDQQPSLECKIQPYRGDDLWLELKIPGATIEPEEITLHPMPRGHGLVLSGVLPRWLCAAIVYRLALNHSWIGVDDPRLNTVIVVYSRDSWLQPGDVLPRVERAHISTSGASRDV